MVICKTTKEATCLCCFKDWGQSGERPTYITVSKVHLITGKDAKLKEIIGIRTATYSPFLSEMIAKLKEYKWVSTQPVYAPHALGENKTKVNELTTESLSYNS